MLESSSWVQPKLQQYQWLCRKSFDIKSDDSQKPDMSKLYIPFCLGCYRDCYISSSTRHAGPLPKDGYISMSLVPMRALNAV